MLLEPVISGYQHQGMDSVLETVNYQTATKQLRTECDSVEGSREKLPEKQNNMTFFPEITFIAKCRSIPRLVKFFENAVSKSEPRNDCEVSANVPYPIADNEEVSQVRTSESNSSMSTQESEKQPSPIALEIKSNCAKTPTPIRLRNSLGACSGGKDMSWNSSMETPLGWSTPYGSYTSGNGRLKRKRISSGEVRKRVLFDNTDPVSPDIMSPINGHNRPEHNTYQNSAFNNEILTLTALDATTLDVQNTPQRVPNMVSQKTNTLSQFWEESSPVFKNIVFDDTIFEDDLCFENAAADILNEVDDDDDLMTVIGDRSPLTEVDCDGPVELMDFPSSVSNFFSPTPISQKDSDCAVTTPKLKCAFESSEIATRENEVDLLHNFEDQVPQFQAAPCGFVTAKGKSIPPVSAAALERTKKLFDDLESWKPNQQSSISKIPVEVSHPKSKLEHMVNTEADNHQKISTPVVVQKAMATCGFSTASGKKVTISESALKAAKVRAEAIESFSDNLPVCPRSKLNVKESSPTVASECTFPLDKSPQLESAQVPVCHSPVVVRKSAIESQLARIVAKKDLHPGPITGSRDGNAREGCTRVTLRKAMGNRCPKALTRDELLRYGVAPSTMNFRIASAASFEFVTDDRYWPDGCLTLGKYLLISAVKNRISADDICRAFLDMQDVDVNLISKKWVLNHIKWIVWKLAATEVSFPSVYGGSLLNVENVLSQLERRYILEIDRSKRPCLRRITEQDDSALKTMVLCVSAIEPERKGSPLDHVSLELTDGWYAVKAVGDSALHRMAMKKKLRVGDKIITHGAELCGSLSACSPLEAPDSMYLRLHANSTRRARWDAKLGYFVKPEPFVVPLTSLLADGGLVSRCDVTVSRVYPIKFLHQRADGKYSFTNEAGSMRLQTQMWKERQKCIEEIEAEVSKRFQRRADDFKNNMECENVAYEQQIKNFEKFKENMQEEYKKAVNEEMEKRQLSSRFKSERVFKMRVIGTHLQDVYKKTSCILSIWNPNEDQTSLLSEGKSFSIYYLNVRKSKSQHYGQDIELRASPRSIFNEMSTNVADFTPRQVTSLRSIGTLGFVPVHNEVDIVGIVVYVGEAPSGDSNNFQTIYLSDEHRKLVGIKFWGGLKAFCVENVIEMRSPLVASNLQWRSLERLSRFPCLHATEYSCFTRTPKKKIFEQAIENLQRNIEDLNALMGDAFAKICAVPSPVRNNLSLDKSSRKSSASKKLAYLNLYRDPDPLPPILTSSSLSVSRDYQSPICHQ